MARKVFFSFHYQNDVWRAMQVRNSWVTKDKEAAGFIDKAEFEKIKRTGDRAIKNWIDEQLKGTSVTVVLIGEETSNREYVKYEIEQSLKKGNGILGVYIHNLKDKDEKTSNKGNDTFGEIGKDKNGESIYFFQVAKTYDYVNNKGYENLPNWIEESLK